MRRWIALGTLLCGAVSGPAGAEVILGLRDGVGNPLLGQVIAGQSFTVEVTLQVTEAEQVIGLGFWLSEPSNIWASGSGLFLSGRFIPAISPFDDPITADSILTSTPANRLDPLDDRDIGVISSTSTAYDPLNDPEVVMELTIGTAVNTPLGLYLIRFSNSPQGIGLEWVDSQYDPHPFDSVGDGYTILVETPEPATDALFALGLAAFGLTARARTGRSVRPRSRPAPRPE